jgi:hypothetical protein
MNLRTEINPKFLLRMGLVGLFCLGMTGWCLKDGLMTYPTQRERALAYLEFKEAHPDMGEKDLFENWKQEAAERGWEPGVGGQEQTPYGKPKKPVDINGQFIMAAVTGLLGLVFVGRVLLNRGRWIEADSNGLRTSENREAQFGQITALNKKKWDNKGIAKVQYEVDGKKNKIVLDDCNYVRDSTQAILRHVEAAIGHDKIINGKPEPPPKPAAVSSSDATSAVKS